MRTYMPQSLIQSTQTLTWITLAALSAVALLLVWLQRTPHWPPRRRRSGNASSQARSEDQAAGESRRHTAFRPLVAASSSTGHMNSLSDAADGPRHSDPAQRAE